MWGYGDTKVMDGHEENTHERRKARKGKKDGARRNRTSLHPFVLKTRLSNHEDTYRLQDTTNPDRLQPRYSGLWQGKQINTEYHSAKSVDFNSSCLQR